MNTTHDETYLALVDHILNHGVDKGDRTGTGTRSVFGYQMRFDLRDGTIPLLTTKKMFTRGIIHEILWYIQGTGNGRYLTDQNINIWKEWECDDGYLGPVYGVMMRSMPQNRYVPVKVRHITDDTTPGDFLSHLSNTIDGKYTGRLFINHLGQEYVVGNKDTNNRYEIQFTDSGWVCAGLTSKSVKDKRVVDQTMNSVYGTGCLGDYHHKKETQINKVLRRNWENMISRCYNSNDKLFHQYGGRGVTVCERWKTLSSFIEDVKKIPNWLAKERNHQYQLDKDYFGYNDLYHPKTTCWVTAADNNSHKQDNHAVLLSNSHTRLFFPSLQSAADYLGVNRGQVERRFNQTIHRTGTNYKIHNFDINPYESSEYVIRAGHDIDQLADAIHRIKTNPNDRRIIVTNWNPTYVPPDFGLSPSEYADMGYHCLPACHSFIQFYVANGELSCQLYQRSCDVGLGVPFNIVQYSILVRMIAHVVGLKPGDFIWTGGDTHIYQNHIDTLKQQLQVSPQAAPTLELIPEITSIDDYQFDDIKIVGYDGVYPTFKMDVSV